MKDRKIREIFYTEVDADVYDIFSMAQKTCGLCVLRGPRCVRNFRTCSINSYFVYERCILPKDINVI